MIEYMTIFFSVVIIIVIIVAIIYIYMLNVLKNIIDDIEFKLHNLCGETKKFKESFDDECKYAANCFDKISNKIGYMDRYLTNIKNSIDVKTKNETKNEAKNSSTTNKTKSKSTDSSKSKAKLKTANTEDLIIK